MYNCLIAGFELDYYKIIIASSFLHSSTGLHIKRNFQYNRERFYLVNLNSVIIHKGRDNPIPSHGPVHRART